MKVSIIIPIYNKSDYLEHCIASVLAQTFLQDIEIILVNDGSTDNSEDICLLYLNRHSKIKYIYQENKGVSAARNNGFKQAIGEYIFFLDADDTIDKNFIELAYNNAKRNNSDVVIVANNIKMGNVKLDKLCYLATWQAFWKHSFLCQTGIKFKEDLSNSEDGLFSFEVLNFTNKISFEYDAIYHYNTNLKNSLHSNIKKGEYYEKLVDIWLKELDTFYNQYKDKLEIEQTLLRFLACHIFYHALRKKNLKIKQKLYIINQLKNFIKKNKLSYIKFKIKSLKYDYAYLYCIFNIFMFC